MKSWYFAAAFVLVASGAMGGTTPFHYSAGSDLTPPVVGDASPPYLCPGNSAIPYDFSKQRTPCPVSILLPRDEMPIGGMYQPDSSLVATLDDKCALHDKDYKCVTSGELVDFIRRNTMAPMEWTTPHVFHLRTFDPAGNPTRIDGLSQAECQWIKSHTAQSAECFE